MLTFYLRVLLSFIKWTNLYKYLRMYFIYLFHEVFVKDKQPNLIFKD